MTPTVEILSESATIGTGFSRVNFVLPASLEWRHGATRIYGSGGSSHAVRCLPEAPSSKHSLIAGW